MSRFNYAKEKAEFDRKWTILEKEYRAAGMSEADIQEMHDYDFGIFKRRRSWAAYETSFSELLPDDTDIDDLSIELSTLGERFRMEDSYQTEATDVRFSWLNEITDLFLLDRLHQLSDQELTVLTQYAIEGKSQREIAIQYGFSQQNLSQKMARIKKFLKNFQNDL